LVFFGLYFITPHGNFAHHAKRKESTSGTPKEVMVAALARIAKSPGAQVVIDPSSISQSAERPLHCAPADSALAIVNREDVAVFANPGKIPVEGWDGDPLKIDPRFEFQILENPGDWVRIRIKAPIWPPDRT